MVIHNRVNNKWLSLSPITGRSLYWPSDMIDARLAKMEAMLESLMKR